MHRRGFLAGALAALGVGWLDTGGKVPLWPAPSGSGTSASDGRPAGTVPREGDVVSGGRDVLFVYCRGQWHRVAFA